MSTASNESRPPLPPFTLETATRKVRLAENAWNSRDPGRVALAYTVDSAWRNRAEFPVGREHIEEFDERGLMARRFASINDLPIGEADRSTTGRRDGVRTNIRDSAHLACEPGWS